MLVQSVFLNLNLAMEENLQQKEGDDKAEKSLTDHKQVGNVEDTSTLNNTQDDTVLNQSADQAVEEGPDFFERLGKKAIWLTLALAACIAAYVYWDFLTLEKILLYKDIGSDSINFYWPFWNEISELIYNEGVPKWSFQVGMGDSLFLLFQGDPFNWILFFLGKDNLPYGLAYVEVIKILLTSLFMFKFLEKLNLTNFAKIVGSLTVAFSGWMIMGTSGWYVFSSQVFYFVLFIYAVESFFQNKNWKLLTLTIALVSCYDLITCIQFLVFGSAYFFVRTLENGSFKPKKLFKDFLLVITCCILAIGISGIFTLNYFKNVFDSARAEGNAKIVSYFSENPLEPVSKNEGISVIARFFSNDTLGTGSDYKGFLNYLEGPTLYVGLLSLIFVLQGLYLFNKKTKIIFGTIILIILLSLSFPYIRYAFWGFQLNYFRIFSFFLSFLLFYISIKSFNQYLIEKRINKKILFSFLIFTYFVLLTDFVIPKSSINSTHTVFIVFLVSIYTLLIYYGTQTKSFNLIKLTLFLTAILEISSLSYNTVNYRSTVISKEIDEKKGYNDYSVEAVNYLKKTDNSFYRIAKMYPSGLAVHMSMNDAMIQNFNGLINYSSIQNKNYINFLSSNEALDKSKADNFKWVYSLLSKPKLFSFTGTKYILDKGDNFNYDSTYIRKIKTINGISIFKNEMALPLFFLQKDWISEKEFKKSEKEIKNNIPFFAVTLPDNSELKSDFKHFNLNPNEINNSNSVLERVTKLKEEKPAITHFSNNKIQLNIHVKEKKLLVSTIPFDSGWKVYSKEKKINTHSVYGGLLAFVVQPNDVEVELKFEPNHILPGLLISIISVIIFFVSLVVIQRKKSTY